MPSATVTAAATDGSPRASSHGSSRAIAISVFVAALALRWAYIIESERDPSLRQPYPGLDAQMTWDAARAIRGDIAPRIEPMVLSAPLHVYWVAAHQAVFGESLHRQRIIAAVWGSLRILITVLLVAAITRQRWPAAIVGLLLAAMPSLIYFDTVLLKASIDLLLMTLLVGLLVWCRPPQARTAAIAIGVATGVLLSLALLSQLATFLYVAPALAHIALAPHWHRRQRAIAAAGAVIVFAAVFAGWQLRGHLGGSARAYLSRDGVDLRIGLSPAGNGTYAPLPGMDNRLTGHAFESRMLAELEVGRRLSWAEANAVHRRAALAAAARDPWNTLRLVGRKLRLLVSNVEIKSEDYLPTLRSRSHVLSASPVSFGWLLVLGVAGAIALCRQRRWSLIALLGGLAGCVAIACCLTFVTWRTRLPLVVPLALLAGPGLLALAPAVGEIGAWARRRAGAPVRSIAVVIAMAAAAAVTFLPPSIPHRRFTALAEGNRRTSARAEGLALQLADLDRRPRPLSRDDAIQRATLLVALERHTEAFAAIRELIADGARDSRVVNDHVRYLLWLDDYDEAERFLAEVERSAPGLHDPPPGRNDLIRKTLAQFVSRSR